MYPGLWPDLIIHLILKEVGVCTYYKEHLPSVRRTDIAFLDECIVAEIKIKTVDETNNFLNGFERIYSSIALESPIWGVVTGDLNAKCVNWWARGINNNCGLELHNLSTLLGYYPN